jgi:hypothetical protein
MTTQPSKYTRTGWHEFLLPAASEQKHSEFLRVWVDIAAVIPLLQSLAPEGERQRYPDVLSADETFDTQRTVLRLVTLHIFAHPNAVRRVSATRQFANELWERFHIGPPAHSVPYPPAIDQADLDPAQVCLALPFVVDRRALCLPEKGGLP